MKVSIQDKEALAAVSPAALSAYARADGWTGGEAYGEHSDIYTREGAPEIIVPRTRRLGDYVSVVSRLVEIFAEAAETDVLSLYRILTTADRDVVRVKATTDGGNGSVSLNEGVELITGARKMALATARSLREPRPAYSGAANREAKEYLRQIRLGQTGQDGFVVTLIGPVIPPLSRKEALRGSVADDEPVARRMTRRLVEALTATREAAERAPVGDAEDFRDAVSRGASANLCDALATMIEPFRGIDVALSWASARPMKAARESVRFGRSAAPILRRAARRFREQKPEVKPDISLIGHIRQLQRSGPEGNGYVDLFDEDGRRFVFAVLNPSDYERALRAHGNGFPVVMNGDLEGAGEKWRLWNPRIVKVISDGDGTAGVGNDNR